MAIREANWLDLPDHLTTLVTDKLFRSDFIRFSAVCKFWLSVYTKHRQHSSPHQIPLLLLQTNKIGVYNVYDLGENRVSSFQVSVPLPKVCRIVASGSHCGWTTIIWIYDSKIQFCLSNPFLPEDKKKINLQPLGGVDYIFDPAEKLVLSADPSSEENFVVMVILGRGKVAFLKPASNWICLDTQLEGIEDALYYRDQFYFVDTSGTVYACDLNQPSSPKVLIVAPPPYSKFWHGNYDGTKYLYLVELLSGELLLIKRVRKYIDDGVAFYTIGFSAYKMNPSALVEQPNKWIEVHDLCGETVFLDDYSSFSLQASEFAECKPNCIYFIDRGYFYIDEKCGWILKAHDPDASTYSGEIMPDYVGVFNLVDGNVIERNCPLENPIYYFKKLPFWNEPKLVRHS